MGLSKMAFSLTLAFISLVVNFSQSQDAPLLRKINTTDMGNLPPYFGGDFVHDSTLIHVGGWATRGMKVTAYSGLIFFDISNLSNIHEITRYQSEQTGFYGVDDGPDYLADMKWPFVYLPAENQLEIVDISNPSVPVLVGAYPGIHGGVVLVQKRRALLVSRFTSAIELLDVSDPAQPTKLSSASLPGSMVKIIWDGGNYAYLLIVAGSHFWEGWATYFSVLDLSNPSQIQLISTIETPNANGFNRIGSCLFVNITPINLSIPRHIQVYDISNPSSPVMKEDYQADYSPNTLIPVGEYYIGTDGYSSGLGVYDLDGLFLNQIDCEKSGKTYSFPVWNGKNLFVLHPVTQEISVYETLFPSKISFFGNFR